jgi:hypothetical protein
MPTIASWAFVLAVPDLRASAAYFRDVLGFRVLWDEAPDWRLVERDGLRVMLGHSPRDLRPAELGSHHWFGYLNVDGVDALHDELTARGAMCTQPTDKPYGMRSSSLRRLTVIALCPGRSDRVKFCMVEARLSAMTWHCPGKGRRRRGCLRNAAGFSARRKRGEHGDHRASVPPRRSGRQTASVNTVLSALSPC